MQKATFTADNGIYGKRDHPAYVSGAASAFAIYKGHRIWTIGHRATGRSLDSLIPATAPRTRGDLCAMVKRLEAIMPTECATLAGIAGEEFTNEQREAGQALRRYTHSVLS